MPHPISLLLLLTLFSSTLSHALIIPGANGFAYQCPTQESIQNALIGACPGTRTNNAALTGAYASVNYYPRFDNAPYDLLLQCQYDDDVTCRYTNLNSGGFNKLKLSGGPGSSSCRTSNNLPEASYAPRRRSLSFAEALAKRVYVGGIRPPYDIPATTGGSTGTFKTNTIDNRSGSYYTPANSYPYSVGYGDENGGYSCSYNPAGNLADGPSSCPIRLCPAVYPARRKRSGDHERVARNQVDVGRLRGGSGTV